VRERKECWPRAAWLAVALSLALAGGCDGAGGGPVDDRDATGDVAPGDAAGDATPDAAGDATPDGAGDAADGGPADAPQDAGDAGGPPGPAYLARLATGADFARVAKDGEVKYLARVPGATPPAALTEDCYFQDMHVTDWHLTFLRRFPGLEGLTLDGYVQLTQLPGSRVLWGGSVRAWPAVVHPVSGATGVFTFSVYSDRATPGSLTVAGVVEVAGILRACAPFAADLLAFTPDSIEQKAFLQAAGPTLTERGVAWLMPEQLVSGLPFVPYSAGEGYGTLRVVPRGTELEEGAYGPRDVVVVERAPNDIALVSGLITVDPQNLHSHVNLRLSEKGIPNAAVPGIYENAFVASLDGGLVHLVVSEAAVTLQPARLEDARAFWEAQRPDVGEVRADLSVRALASFADLDHADAVAYGAKAANLGELYAALPAAHRIEGFGVPFAWYADFVTLNDFDERIAALVADPRMESDRFYRTDRLDDLRDDLKVAPLPPGFEAALHERLRAAFGDDVETTRIRFRSSTNAEDLVAFSGAGLYDSRSGCLGDDLDGDTLGPSRCLSAAERAHIEAQLAAWRAELRAHPERSWLVDLIDEAVDDLSREKPVAAAVRKVWASLWNDRAWEERAWYGVDHEAVHMGIAVEKTFVMERVNAVAVTNLDAGTGAPLYRVVSLPGEWSVVRPEVPTLVPEVLTFRRSGEPPEATEVTVVVPTSALPAGETVWTEAEQETLAALLFAAQDHFAAHVYPELRPLRLDIELKLTADGVVQLKQARPYLGADGP
jgi:hypothetical protein